MKKIFKKITVIFLAGLLFVSTFGCNGGANNGGGSNADKTINANYVITKATSNGKNVISRFLAYRVEFKDNNTMRVSINYLNAMQTRNSTYIYTGNVITETYRNEKFIYNVQEDGTIVTEMKDFDDVIEITLTKELDDSEVDKTVEFEGVLFGDDVDDCKIFNYCPAVITEKDENGDEIMHIWYCTNKDDGVIMDHIGYRKGVKQENGRWLFSKQKIVLKPTDDTWDARHTCDPAVIRGEFKYQGVTYGWLMAYLGCITEDYGNNETGIAVANSPEGPWIKIDHMNPIIPWQDGGINDNGQWNWGTGMPALISMDQKGEVLLFYRSGIRGTGVQRWDLSNLDATDLKPKFTATITSSGIVNSVGQKCSVGIPDFAYDSVKKRFYVCSTTNEKNPADVTLTRVNSHSSVAYIENIDSLEELSALLESGQYTWKMLGFVGPAQTGWNRNHNPAIVRDAYGYMPESDRIGVVVSTGHNDRLLENIFTYRLHGYYLEIK